MKRTNKFTVFAEPIFALYFSMQMRIHMPTYICIQPATPKVNKGHREKVNKIK